MQKQLELNARQQQNLFKKIEVTGFCWNWAGPLNPRGYGQFRVGVQMLRAHRVLYSWLVGPIAEGLVLDHLCENQACVNPDHLKPTTQKFNVLRGHGISARNAKKTCCPIGHPLEGENLYTKPDGRRVCRICKRAQLIRWKATRRGLAA